MKRRHHHDQGKITDIYTFKLFGFTFKFGLPIK